MSKPIKITQDDFDKLLRRTFNRHFQLCANNNFYIEGFEQHKYGTLLQAFAEELKLVKIESLKQKE